MATAALARGDALAAGALRCLRLGDFAGAAALHEQALAAGAGDLALAYLEPLLHAVRGDWAAARDSLAMHARHLPEPQPADLGELAVDLAAPRLAYRVGGGSTGRRLTRAARALRKRTPRPVCACGRGPTP